MVDEQVPHPLAVQVGDLEAVGVARLLRLEHGVQVPHGDDGFGNFGLLAEQIGRLGSRTAVNVRRQRRGGGSHLSVHEVSEGEISPGQEEPLLQKLLVVFALFPQRRLKHVWIRKKKNNLCM